MSDQSPISQIVMLLLIIIVAVNMYTGAFLQEIGIPGVVTFKFGQPHQPEEQQPEEPTDKISGRYSMDGDMGRIIEITHLDGNQYSIGQPSGVWPWRGTATLDGGRLLGDGMSTGTPATFKVEGVVLEDGSIDVNIRFITDIYGNNAGGRVDPHRWLPIS